jgi:hypothetical protein
LLSSASPCGEHIEMLLGEGHPPAVVKLVPVLSTPKTVAAVVDAKPLDTTATRPVKLPARPSRSLWSIPGWAQCPRLSARNQSLAGREGLPWDRLGLSETGSPFSQLRMSNARRRSQGALEDGKHQFFIGSSSLDATGCADWVAEQGRFEPSVSREDLPRENGCECSGSWCRNSASILREMSSLSVRYDFVVNLGIPVSREYGWGRRPTFPPMVGRRPVRRCLRIYPSPTRTTRTGS